MANVHNDPEQTKKQKQDIGGGEIFGSSSSENILRNSDSDFDSENDIKPVESSKNQQKENNKEFSKENEIVKKFKSAGGEENYDMVLDILSNPNNMKEIFNSYDDYGKIEFINFLFECSEKGKTEEINKKVSENILLEIFKPGKMKEFLESHDIDKEKLINFLAKIAKYKNLNKKVKNNIREIFNFIKEKQDIILFEKLSKKIVNSGLFNITPDEVGGNYNELSGEYRKFVNSLNDFMKKNKEISENREKIRIK